MNPSTQLRLSTMMRAMTDIILPAIPASESMAQEQSQLLIGHIAALMAQDGRERELQAHNAANLIDVAKQLILLAELEKLAAEKLAELNAALAGNDIAKIAFASERLMADCDVSAGFKSKSSELMINYARHHSVVGRSWFSPMGFDSKPEELLDVASLLTASAANN
ncbi:MAG: hypothetical protein ACJA1I_002823 [Zhongshania marina]|mgnify:FL=1|jgi:hypothetical protein|uniref:Uncharacterized protein n=1 Tax=Zhongshania marina TaxID=2304603 RepID=A0A2S4HCP5_9GAMM|nr:hypothetical protein [Marortus luteolus]POP51709.1 hypothetical protein C0068_15220 [Marortus luteolus]RNL61418.1 hypothetical protein D0911_12225 [Zhongshania marina]